MGRREEKSRGGRSVYKHNAVSAVHTYVRMCPWSRTQVCPVTSRRHNAHCIHTVCTRVPMTG